MPARDFEQLEGLAVAIPLGSSPTFRTTRLGPSALARGIGERLRGGGQRRTAERGYPLIPLLARMELYSAVAFCVVGIS